MDSERTVTLVTAFVGTYFLLLIVTYILFHQDAYASHTVSATPTGGIYNTSQLVALESSEPSTTIYYTTDGSIPTVNSTQYDGTLISITTNMTVSFIAVELAQNHTAVGMEVYVILLPPSVSDVEPENGEKRVDVFSIINATFTAPMNGSTINTDTFLVVDQFGFPASGTVAYDILTSTASFTPDPSFPLQYGVDYTATLTEQITDITGSGLERKSWNFTTGGQINISLLDAETFTALSGSSFTITPNPFTLEGSLEVTDNGILDKDYLFFGSKFDGFIIISNVDNSFRTYVVSETTLPAGYTKIYTDLIVSVAEVDACGDLICSGASPLEFRNLNSSRTISDLDSAIGIPSPYLNSSQFELYRDDVIIGQFSGVADTAAFPTLGPIVDFHASSIPSGLAVKSDAVGDLTIDSFIFPFTAPSASNGPDLFQNFQIPTYPGLKEDVITNDTVYAVPPIIIRYEESKDNFILTPIIDKIFPNLTLSMEQLSFVESKVAKFEKVNMTFNVEGDGVGFSFGITDKPPAGTPPPSLDAPALFLDVGFVGNVDFSNPSAFKSSPLIDILVNKTLPGFQELPNGCADFKLLFFDGTDWTEVQKLNPTGNFTDFCPFTLEPEHFSKFGVGGVKGETISTESVLPLARHHGGGGGGSASIQQVTSGTDVESEFKFGSDSVIVTFDTVESGSDQLKVSTSDITKFTGIFDKIVTQNGEQEGMVQSDGSTFLTSGKIFDIDASAVKFDGMVKVAVPYDERTALSSGSEFNVRFLHYNEEDENWEDATISIDAASNIVTGMINSLSPVVAAVVDDGTFPSIYFDENPLSEIRTDDKSYFIDTAHKGEQVSIPITIKNVQRADQQFTLLVQILDGDGIARFIGLQTGSLAKGESTEISNSWTPEQEGNYTVHVFVWDVMDKPSPLSEVHVIKLGVR